MDFHRVLLYVSRSRGMRMGDWVCHVFLLARCLGGGGRGGVLLHRYAQPFWNLAASQIEGLESPEF
jgi:hypothetical protein